MINQSLRLYKYAMAGALAGALACPGCRKKEPSPLTKPVVSSQIIRDPQKLYFQDGQMKMLLTSREYRGGELCLGGQPVDLHLASPTGGQSSHYAAIAREILLSVKGEDFKKLSNDKQQAAVDSLAGKIGLASQGDSFLGLVEATDGSFLSGYRDLCAGRGGLFPPFVYLGISAAEVDAAMKASEAVPVRLILSTTEPLLPLMVVPGEKKSFVLALRMENGELDPNQLRVSFSGRESVSAVLTLVREPLNIRSCPLSGDTMFLTIELAVPKTAKKEKKNLVVLSADISEPLLTIPDALEIVENQRPNDRPAKCSSYEPYLQDKFRETGQCVD